MKPTTEPTARLSSGRIVTESEVRTVLERAGLSYPLPATRAAIYATQGAAPGTVSPSGLLDTGRQVGTSPACCAGDGDADAECLTMADHLEQHPEDAVCPVCEADPEVQPRCPRCLGDGRRGEDCPVCRGEGSRYLSRYDDWEECGAEGCRCGRIAVEEATCNACSACGGTRGEFDPRGIDVWHPCKYCTPEAPR